MKINTLIVSGDLPEVVDAKWISHPDFNALIIYMNQGLKNRITQKQKILVHFTDGVGYVSDYEVDYSYKAVNWTPVLDLHAQIMATYARGQKAFDIMAAM